MRKATLAVLLSLVIGTLTGLEPTAAGRGFLMKSRRVVSRSVVVTSSRSSSGLRRRSRTKRRGRSWQRYRRVRARRVCVHCRDFANTRRRTRERLQVRPLRSIRQLVIHHSASASGSVEEFRRLHRSKGWADIGYHAVIGNGKGSPDGHIGQGRADNLVGAGVRENNGGMLHVCLVGNFHRPDKGFTGLPTPAQMDALGHWLLVKGRAYGPKFDRNPPAVTDHRSAALPQYPTACPGDEFPTAWVRSWCLDHVEGMVDRSHLPSLAGFLQQKGYWQGRRPNQQLPSAPTPGRRVIFALTDDRQIALEAQDTRSIGGVTFVALRPLAALLGWVPPKVDEDGTVTQFVRH